MLAALLTCGSANSDVINSRLETVIIPSRFLFGSSSRRRVFADYYFFAGQGGCVRLLMTNCAIVASTSLRIVSCGLFWFLGDVSSSVCCCLCDEFRHRLALNELVVCCLLWLVHVRVEDQAILAVEGCNLFRKLK